VNLSLRVRQELLPPLLLPRRPIRVSKRSHAQLNNLFFPFFCGVDCTPSTCFLSIKPSPPMKLGSPFLTPPISLLAVPSILFVIPLASNSSTGLPPHPERHSDGPPDFFPPSGPALQHFRFKGSLGLFSLSYGPLEQFSFIPVFFLVPLVGHSQIPFLFRKAAPPRYHGRERIESPVQH